MKSIIFILLCCVLSACGTQKGKYVDVVTEFPTDSFVSPDSTLRVNHINDAILVQQREDSIRRLIFVRDSMLRVRFVLDSLDRAEFVRDSIAFRKTVKTINGGYNGWDDRYKKWLKAREVLKAK